jgi:succinoglycan biosynthesis protein ExoA
MTQSQLPFITVVMPVRNEAQFVGETLSDLLKQDYPQDRYEIIVADGHSTDNTRKVVESLSDSNSQIIFCANDGMRSSSGRNIGFRYGRGEYYLVVDGHCKITNRQLFRNMVGCFKSSGAQCLGRPQPFVIPEERTMQRAIGLARSSRIGHSNQSLIHSGKEGFVSPISVGCAYKREVFEEIGFVDETFDACEDVEFNCRVEKAGFKTFFSPSIAVYYYPREDLKSFFRQLVRYGEGRIRYIAKHPEKASFEMFLPLLFTLAVSLGFLLAMINRYFLYSWLIGVLVYLLVILEESIRLGAKNGLLFSGRLSVAFFAIHISLGIGLLKGVCQGIMKKVTPNRKI